MATVAERVAAGAAWLDQHEPRCRPVAQPGPHLAVRHNPSRRTGAPDWAPRCNWCRWLTTLCVDPQGHADAMDYYAWWRAAAAARWAR
jgi:hypothetical protein